MADSRLSDAATVALAGGDLFPFIDISNTAENAAGSNAKATLDTVSAYVRGQHELFNAAVTTQGAGFASDTYLTGSSITFVNAQLKAKTMYRCRFNVVKTAAGTATPIIQVRMGTAGTTADTSRGTMTWSAQTAVADEGIFEIRGTFWAVGASMVLQMSGSLTHRLSITGLGVGVSEAELSGSGAFDGTTATVIGLSVNGGASAAWTVSNVQTELVNLA